MFSAAIRFGTLATFTAVVAAGVRAAPAPAVTTPPAPAPMAAPTTPPAAAPVRAAPSRPMLAPILPAGVRLGGVEYVSALDVALWLGCKGVSADPPRRLALIDKSNPANKAELSADTRDTIINGERVFLGRPPVVHDGRLFLDRIDATRCLAPLLRPGLGAEPPAPPRLIVIDPGHGGEDPGTENRMFGLREKVLTLDVALRAKKLLEAAGFKVLLTRSTDTALSPNKTLDLALRPDFARRARADLFVSIHFNAAANTRGTEVFSFAPRTQRATDSWGLHADDSENAEAPANKFDHWNTVLASALHRSLLQSLKTEDRGKKIAHWAVLRTLDCPGVLVEPAIITNDADARKVATPAFRDQIAAGIAAGIQSYVATLDSLRAPVQPPAATDVRPNASIPR